MANGAQPSSGQGIGEQAKRSIPVLLVLCTMAIMVMQATPNAISGVLNDYAGFYNMSFTNFSVIATISSLTALPTLLGANALINKFGLKTCCIVSTVGVMIAGFIPGLVPLSFEALLAVRGIFGVFFGLAVPLGITVATYYFEDEGLRANVIGWSMALISAFNIILNLGGSLLASVSLQWVWLIYLVLIIPVALMFIMPKPQAAEKQDAESSHQSAPNAAESDKPSSAGDKVSGETWFYVCVYVLLNFFSAAFMLNVSALVVGEGIGTAINASTMFSIQAIAGMAIGLVFGKLNNKLGALFPVAIFACSTIAFVGFCATNSLPLLYVSSIFYGIGYIGGMTWVNNMISATAPLSKTAMVVGVANTGAFTSMFIYNFVVVALAGVFGMAGSNRFAFYLSLVFFAALAVLFAVRAFGAKRVNATGQPSRAPQHR